MQAREIFVQGDAERRRMEHAHGTEQACSDGVDQGLVAQQFGPCAEELREVLQR
jgi:hypothetical protein